MGLSVLKPVPGKLGRVSHLKNIHIKLLSKQYWGGWAYPHCSFCISCRVGFHHPHYALELFHFTTCRLLPPATHMSFLPELCLRIIPSRFPKSPISHQNLYFLKSHCWSQQDTERKAFHFSAVKRLRSRAPGQGAGGKIHTPSLPTVGWVTLQIVFKLWVSHSEREEIGWKQAFSPNHTTDIWGQLFFFVGVVLWM